MATANRIWLLATTLAVLIRLGDGLGGFTWLNYVSAPFNPTSVVIGDFNGDGNRIWLLPTQPQT